MQPFLQQAVDGIGDPSIAASKESRVPAGWILDPGRVEGAQGGDGEESGSGGREASAQLAPAFPIEHQDQVTPLDEVT